MQPDPLDELRARVDQTDINIGTHPQMVGGQRAGVTAPNDDDLGGRVVVISHALKTPLIAES